MLRRLLDLRRRRHEAFAPGASYVPMSVRGPEAERIVAFGRSDDIVVVVARWPMRGVIAPDGAIVDVGPGIWRDVLTDRSHDLGGATGVAGLLGTLPVAVLERS